MVHPNNPTGHFTSRDDIAWLEAFCAEHGLALIVDEVFLDYSLGGSSNSFLGRPSPALTFVLSGLSKISGLPQMKMGWIAAHGPGHLVSEALARLEMIADTYLSVSTPMQLALPALLEARHQMRPQILTRLQGNLKTLDALLNKQSLVRRLPVAAGWYTVLHIPEVEPSEDAAVRLVRSTGVYVHPGSFFGFTQEGMMVVSLLTPKDVFERGISLLLNHIQTFE